MEGHREAADTTAAGVNLQRGENGMMYTVGFGPSMDKLIDEAAARGETITKPAKGEGHPTHKGSIVFETPASAQAWIDKFMTINQSTAGYKVYTIGCTIEQTEQLQGEEFRRLLVKSVVGRL